MTTQPYRKRLKAEKVTAQPDRITPTAKYMGFLEIR
jgi:hypothetical protein